MRRWRVGLLRATGPGRYECRHLRVRAWTRARAHRAAKRRLARGKWMGWYIERDSRP